MAQPRKAQAPQYGMGRYLLTGAGLGFYFGLFFQPLREPNLLLPLLLGSGGALLMTLLNLRRPQGRSPRGAARHALTAWLALTLTLLVLEGRHPMYAVAGKLGVSLFTTAAGALGGALYGWRSREKGP